MNYELEIEDKIKEILKYRFNAKDIIFYIFLRYMIINNIKEFENIKTNDFIIFLLKECNLPMEVIYKGTNVSLFESSNQSILNVVNGWILD
jgi:hypothetical protein